MCNSFRLATAFALSTFASAAAAAPPMPPAYAAPMPAYATPLFDAYFNVAAGYGWNSFDVTGAPISIDNNGLAVRGRATFEAAVTDRLGAQVDGVLGYDANALSSGGTSIDDPTTTATLASHFFWRDPNVGLIGAIGQYTHQTTRLDESVFGLDIDGDNYFAGLEGQYFLNNVTLYAQAAYHSKTLGIEGEAIDGDGFTLAGQARYFVMPDWSVTAKGSYDTVDYDVPVSSATLKESNWSVGLRSDYRFAATPVSIFGELTYGENTFKVTGIGSASITEKDTRAMVGIQYNLGTRTLQERDRAGGSLDPFDTHFSFPFFL